MKLNLGCGVRKLPGFVNVDAVSECSPDQVFDLEQTPWPWSDSSANEIRLIHSLEHMGALPKVFLAIMSELYRISADRCEIIIHVPHPRHDNFISDPTHVRPITIGTLSLFDYALCNRAISRNAANTPLAHYLGVDFEVVHVDTVLDEPYFSRLKNGEISKSDVELLLKNSYNISSELRFRLVSHKPLRLNG